MNDKKERFIRTAAARCPMATDQQPSVDLAPYAEHSPLTDPVGCFKAYQASPTARFTAASPTVEVRRRFNIGSWNPIIPARHRILTAYIAPEAEPHMDETLGTFYFFVTTNGTRQLCVTDDLGKLLAENIQDPRLPKLEQLLSRTRISDGKQSRIGLPDPAVLQHLGLALPAGQLYLMPDQLGVVAYLKPESKLI